jgi:hypothetical protein
VKSQALIILLVLYIPAAYAESPEYSLRSSEFSKIHPILIQWQTHDDPEAFAKNNNLSYFEGKVGVYIHMNSTDYFSKIPPEIEVTAHDGKVLVALVSSEQLGTLSELDFVDKITLPDLARTPPIPKVEIPLIESDKSKESLPETSFDYLIWLVIVGIVITISLMILKMKKRQN